MTRFLPAWIFSVSVLAYGCRAVHLGSRANPFEVQMDVPGVEEDWTGYEEAVHGSKGRFGAWQGTCPWRVMMPRAARDDATRGPTFILAARSFSLISSFFLSFFSLDPTSPLLALLLISRYPRL